MVLELTKEEAKTLLAAIGCVLDKNVVWLKDPEAEGLLNDVWIKITTYFDEVSQ